MGEIFESFLVLTLSVAILGIIFYLVKSIKKAPKTAKDVTPNEFEKGGFLKLNAFASGELIPLSSVKDDVFASLTLGDGAAIIPKEGELFSPCDATVTTIADTHHAVTLKTDTGVKILLHIGIDTVNLKGKFFTSYIKEGSRVKKGERLIKFELDKIKYLKYDPTICMAVYADKEFELVKNMDVKRNVTKNAEILGVR